MAVKKVVFAQAFLIACLVGFGVWLFVQFGAVSGILTCILDQIAVLRSIKGSAGGLATQITSQIPTDITSLIEQWAPLLAVLVIVPAALICIVELIIILLSCNFCKNSRWDEICAKCMIFILLFFLLLGFISYAVIGGIGIAINNVPDAQVAIAMVDSTCDTFIPKLAKELDSYEAILKTQQGKVDDAIKTYGKGAVPASTQEALDKALFELGEGKRSIDSFGDICDCVQRIVPTIQTFVVPGLGCAVCCLVLMFVNCCACCALGCCGEQKTTTKPKEDAKKGVEFNDMAVVSESSAIENV